MNDGLFNPGSWCHFLSLRNALKALVVIADACRHLMRTKLGMAFSEIFGDRAKVFDLRNAVDNCLVQRSGDVFLVRTEHGELANVFFQKDRDTSETFARLIAASSVAGCRAEPFAAIFRCVATVTYELQGNQVTCVAPHEPGSRTRFVTLLHSESFQTVDHAGSWPSEHVSKHCAACGVSHSYVASVTAEDPPRVWAFHLVGPPCQASMFPLHFAVTSGGSLARYVLGSYVRVQWVGQVGGRRHCVAVVRVEGSHDGCRVYDDRYVAADQSLPLVAPTTVRDQAVLVLYVRVAEPSQDEAETTGNGDVLVDVLPLPPDYDPSLLLVPAGSPVHLSHPRDGFQLVGIPNPGVRCYLGVIMQVLAAWRQGREAALTLDQGGYLALFFRQVANWEASGRWNGNELVAAILCREHGQPLNPVTIQFFVREMQMRQFGGDVMRDCGELWRSLFAAPGDADLAPFMAHRTSSRFVGHSIDAFW